MSSNKTTVLDTVFSLRDSGFSVIPSGGGNSGKAPLVKWKAWQDRVPDEQQLRSWQQVKKPTLWGIVTNSRVVIIDADTLDARAKLETEIGSPHVLTPRGAHFYIGTTGHPLKTIAGILPGIDVRGVGGFVNIVGENPKTGGEYKIIRLPAPENLIPYDKLPEFILNALDNNEPATKPAPKAEPSSPIPEGERNDWLFRRACGYRNKGDPEGSIFKKVKIDYEERCEHDPPMSDRELRNCCHSAAEYEPGTEALKLLPFEVEEVIQYGEQEAEYTIVTKSGQHIDMGDTAAFLSARRARQRLFEREYFLSPKAFKYWLHITEALMPLIQIEPLPSKLEETEQWLRNFLASRSNILLIDPDDPKRPDSLSKALTIIGHNSIVRDKQGRVYLSSNSVIGHARMLFGQSLTLKALAIRLRKIGFESAGVASNYLGGKRSQARMWMSPVGYLPPADEDVETPAVAFNRPGDTYGPIEEDDDDFSPLKPALTPLEETARKLREEGK